MNNKLYKPKRKAKIGKKIFNKTPKQMKEALEFYKRKRKQGKKPHYIDSMNGKKLEIRYCK